LRKIGLLLLLVVCFFVKNAESEEFLQKMQVEIGVFDAAEVELFYKEFDGKYVINADVKTANFFNTMYPFRGKYEARGIDYRGDIKPVIYMTETKSRNHVRTKKIFYDNQGVAYKRESTKDEKKSEVLIKDVPNSADASDLQTVFAELIKKFSKNRSCQLTREIYDGKKHYRVIAEDKGVENRWFDFMKKNDNAYKCSIFIKNLKENNDNILWDVSADKPINLWLGVDKTTGLPLIYEIKIDSTPLGELKVMPSNLDVK